MGIISELAGRKDARRPRVTWRESAAVSKEEPRARPDPAAGQGRSLSSTGLGIQRLLQAMRSNAPGGWTDDRWEQSRHYVGIAYVAIHRQNEHLSQSEFQVYRKDNNSPDGKVPVEPDHPLIRLLSKPNDDDSFGDLMSNWNMQMDLTGSALTWVVPNALGEPFQLFSIPTAVAIPIPTTSPQYPNGAYRVQPMYTYGGYTNFGLPASAAGAVIDADWIMHMRYPHPLFRNEGYSPLTALRLHMDEVESIDRSRWYSMKRNINPDAVLNSEEAEGTQPLDDAAVDRIIAQFEQNFMGAENSGKLLVSEPGWKLERFNTSPREMDHQAGWEQLSSFVLGGLGITKPAAGMVEDSSYSTLFATLKQLYWTTLEPKANRIAQKLTRQLAKYFGDDLIIEIRCRRIDDHEVDMKKIDTGMRAKAITKNQVLKMLDMPVTSEEWGNDIAGDPSPNEMKQQEKQQQGMGGGMPGAPGAEAAPGESPPDEGGSIMGMLGLDAQPDNPEAEAERPSPGNLSAGALGPRGKSHDVRRIRTLIRAAVPHVNGHTLNGRH